MKRQREHELIGIGFGPANVAVAVARDELFPDLDIRFLERQGGPLWQPGMLFEDADIQNHALRDLVTPRNPRSRYSFTNFLFETDRLFEHLNLGMLFPLRIEYAQYIAWVADHSASSSTTARCRGWSRSRPVTGAAAATSSTRAAATPTGVEA